MASEIVALSICILSRSPHFVPAGSAAQAYDAPARRKKHRNARAFEMFISFILSRRSDCGNDAPAQAIFQTLTTTSSAYRSASPRKIDLLSQSYFPSGG